jgi:hypothetical protein
MLGPCPQVDVHDGRELHKNASRRSAKSEKTIVVAQIVLRPVSKK